MIGLDTNVLVRYIVRDDEAQARAATRLIESRCSAEDPGLVNLVVLCELVWVLGRGYGYDKGVVSGVLRRILTVKDLRVERAELAWTALNLYESGRANFADYLIGIINREEGVARTCSFDRRTLDCDLFAPAESPDPTRPSGG